MGLRQDSAAALGVRVERTARPDGARGRPRGHGDRCGGPDRLRGPHRPPQLARRLVRTPYLPYLPLLTSALSGAVVLVVADLAARMLVPPLEIPVGALTALVGGPYLLWLLGRRAGG
ncbi:iron chelate uptake ABC transporter family permease subunit [Streptomyces sp. NPDC090994]|uniref:iron chelate uptake ABC transporter family permease subunit n=1 Tax=Streptomyces sp. NPDC090994 TaxID=3365969 RepID=UPI0037F7D725